MDPDVRHIVLGGNIAILVVTLAWNVYWRHYSRFCALIFPRSSRTAEKKAIRVFFALSLLGGLLGVAESARMTNPTLGDLGWSTAYGAIIAALFFALDAIVTWLNR